MLCLKKKKKKKLSFIPHFLKPPLFKKHGIKKLNQTHPFMSFYLSIVFYLSCTKLHVSFKNYTLIAVNFNYKYKYTHTYIS